MKNILHTRLLGWVCAGALASCAAPSEQPVKMKVSGSLSSKPATSNTSSGQVFERVNEYRLSRGKTALQRHGGLDQLAQNHCEYLREHRGSFSLYGTKVSHMGFDGRVAVARHRYQMENMSENVAAACVPGQVEGQVMVDLWKSSKDHHKNMLDNWTYTGVGVVKDADGTVFSTQLFGNGGYSQITPRDRFNRF